MTAIAYSRGRNAHDVWPAQKTAKSFDAFIDAQLADGTKAKSSTATPYICGPLHGNRKRGLVSAGRRRFLVVDMDRCPPELLPQVRSAFQAGFRCALWPTHSSTLKAPRYRVFIELSREVDRDEGIAIGRVLIAEKVRAWGDAVRFDESTFRAEQPVYVPPAGAVAEKFFEAQPLDVERYLREAASLPPPPPSSGATFKHAEWRSTPDPDVDPSLIEPDDEKLIDKAIASKSALSAFGDGISFADCWTLNEPKLGEARQSDSGDAFDRSDIDYQVACELAYQTGCDPERIERIMLDGPLAREKFHRHDGTFGTYLRRTILNACAAKRAARLAKRASAPVPPPPEPGSQAAAIVDGVPPPPSPEGQPPAPAAAVGPPVIEIQKGQRAAIVTKLAEAFAAGKGPYYRRNSVLVRATTLPADEEVAGIKRFKGSVQLRDAKGPAVIADASLYATCTTYDGRSKTQKVIDLPEPVAQSFIETGLEQRALHSIIGVTRCPVMREDGSLLMLKGYDPVTKLILASEEDWSQLKVPERVTKDQAAAELAWLLDWPFRDFPYADEPSRSVSVSAVLSGVLRPAMDCTPMHGNSAPGHAEGKSLLAELTSIVVTGTQPAMIAPGHSQEEFEKRIDAAILSGDPVCVIDNASRPITGDNICSAMTSSMAKIRKFGLNEDKTVATSAFWMVTGKNLSGTADMLRRMVCCYIDAHTEQPEFRTGFKVPNLLEWATANRMRLLSAVYTILRAHAQAGYPAPPNEKVLANFETWSRRVAHCLVWLGMANPIHSQDRLRKDDAKRENRGVLFAALHAWQSAREPGKQAWTVQEVKAAVAGVVFAKDDGLTQAVADALIDSVPGGTEQLPYWLRAQKNVTTGGYRLEEAVNPDKHNKVNRWLVLRPNRRAGDAGDAGDV